MDSRKNVCPLCGVGTLEVHYDRKHQFLAGRHKHTVTGLEHSVCSSCGTSLCSGEQLDRNVARIEAYQAELRDFISPEKIAALRARYGISQSVAAKIFGGGPNAFSKYERGETSPSAAAASLMLVCLDAPSVFRAIANTKGVELPLQCLQAKEVAAYISSVSIKGEMSHAISNHFANLDIDHLNIVRVNLGYIDQNVLVDIASSTGNAEALDHKEKQIGHGGVYLGRRNKRTFRNLRTTQRAGYVGQQDFGKTSGRKWHATIQ